MINLWFLLEEISMKNTLDILLPKLIDAKQFIYSLHVHDGCHDLIKSIPNKINASKNLPNTYIVILIDQDNHDCTSLKQQINQMFIDKNVENKLIRIVVHELESWFIGDMSAIAKAFDKPAISALQNKKQYRNPDELPNPKQIIINLFKNHNINKYNPNSSSKKIAPYLTVEENKSISFHQFIIGLNNYMNRLKLPNY
jgi:hypothetical protein